MAQSKPNRFRRADNGQYTTEQYANRHPDTTVHETDNPPKRKPKKG